MAASGGAPDSTTGDETDSLTDTTGRTSAVSIGSTEVLTSNPTSDTSDTSDGFCGDSVLDPGEQCDPGEPAIGPGQFCLEGCIINVCGDGDTSPDEECDDANFDNGDGCTNECTISDCGNTQVEFGEQCDDGNNNNNDDCLNSCEFATCGDGFLLFGSEECDNGDGNAPWADCVPTCTLNICGDGFEHAANEECDPGLANIGPGLSCRSGCVLNFCGDGDPWIGVEACDDGNPDNSDACAACSPAVCGDGFVFVGNEECDDDNGDDEDICHNDCSNHRAIDLALGGNHTCALFDSGLVKCWGNGNNGRTGHGNEFNIGDNEPASAGDFIELGIFPVAGIKAGLSHTCAVYGNGALRCWGRALEGQLGQGNINDIGDDELPSSLPFVPLFSTTTLADTRGGSFHNCAVINTGAIKCWGSSAFSQLGTPGFTARIGDDEPAANGIPVDIGPGTVTGLAMGSRHSCAVFEDGRVRCWGAGGDGALGYGNVEIIGDDEAPAAAGDVPLGATATSLTAGFYHTCAIVQGNNVRCWGRGVNGRLGYGDQVWIGAAQTPSDAGDVVVGGPVVELAAGSAHTCARIADGTVRCWGFNGNGQLGYGHTQDIGDNEDPSSAGEVPLGGIATRIAADGNHTCAILETGAVRCWGHGGDGRLGYGNLQNIGDDETPAAAGDVPLLAQ